MPDDQLPAAPPLSGNELPRPPAAPSPVRAAAITIFVLALVNLAEIAVVVGSRSRVIKQLRASPSSSRLTDSQFNAVANVSIAVSVIVSVLFAALLVWLGVKVISGRNWARITVTVVLALGLLTSIYSLTRPNGAWGLVLNGASDVLSVLVLVFLWGPAASRAHFAKRPTT